MKELMHMLFLSCQKATGLIEKQFLFKLSWKERLQLRMHKAMCEACTLYEKQSLLLNRVLEKSMKYDLIKPNVENFKSLILQRLDELK